MSENRHRIPGKDATNLALEARNRGPVRLERSDGREGDEIVPLPSPTVATGIAAGERKPPPRVRKPLPSE